MSAIGPELPPHLLAKRKRQQEEGAKPTESTTTGAQQSRSLEDSEKRRKIIGPTMPPTSFERLQQSDVKPAVVNSGSALRDADSEDDDDDDDDDDEVGPALPGSNDRLAGYDDHTAGISVNSTNDFIAADVAKKPQRDDWMTIAPSHDDLTRLDPSRPRARGFNTGKGAKGPSGADSGGSIWHETPEEKRNRLANEMMGATPGGSVGTSQFDPKIEARRIQERSRKNDNRTDRPKEPSLMEKHTKTKGKELSDDDPSKRAFDREKDIGSGAGISAVQRKTMLKHATNFTSKFHTSS